MKDIDKFLDRLNRLANELEKMSGDFTELYSQYDGSDFEGQNHLAVDRLDNSILAVIHETASTIGFAAADIKTLTDFIDFRKTYKEFTDSELENIIDNSNIDLELKLNLAKRLTNGDAKLLLDKIQIVKQFWNRTFDNCEYRQVRNKYSMVP
jgi:hypothetical protein